MSRYIGYAESVNRVGVFVKAGAASAQEFEQRINNLALGYRVHTVWQARFLKRPELIWTVSESRANELELALKKTWALSLDQVPAPIMPSNVDVHAEVIPARWSLIAAVAVTSALPFIFIAREIGLAFING